MSASSFAQQGNWCGTTALLEKQMQEDPKLQGIFHNSLVRAAANRSNVNSRMAITVPTVVHIIHDNGVGNISDEQIMDALNILNVDYRRENADTSNTRGTANAPFVHRAGGMDIEFKLARIDPDGNCTNGIVRVNAPHLANNAGEDCKDTNNGGSSPWPQDSYFNIWVVNSIDNGGQQGITLGYAYYPYGGPNSGYGILIRNDAFGTIETAQNADGRTLTHEMGHALGLPHIFEEGCHTGDCAQEGDYCCDTPPQQEANWSCNQTWNSCNNVPMNDAYGFDTYDQIENYMSYNACQNMFSLDQVGIMNFNFTDIGFLANLMSAQNIIATGVNEPDQLCKAEFEANNTSICPGSTVTFEDFSFHAPTGWTWSVTPGTAGTDYNFVNGTTSSSQSPQIEFLNSGSYDISLVATDGLLSDTETKSGYITVVPQPATISFVEGFEAYTDLNGTPNWEILNPGGNAAFEVTDAAGHSGVKSVRLSNFGQSGSNSDELISAPVDLSVIDPATEDVTLSFRYSYRKRYESNDEWFRVFITNDCGENWVVRKTMHGSILSPLVQNTFWTPSSESDWTTVHMTNITDAYMVENFRYKFTFEGQNGNNIYIDDINIYKGSPSDEIVGLEVNGDLIESYSLYPNPTVGELNVRFDVANAAEATIEVVDITGKLISTHNIQANSGSNLVVMDATTYATGVYFVNLTLGGVTKVEQLVVK